MFSPEEEQKKALKALKDTHDALLGRAASGQPVLAERGEQESAYSAYRVLRGGMTDFELAATNLGTSQFDVSQLGVTETIASGQPSFDEQVDLEGELESTDDLVQSTEPVDYGFSESPVLTEPIESDTPSFDSPVDLGGELETTDDLLSESKPVDYGFELGDTIGELQEPLVSQPVSPQPVASQPIDVVRREPFASQAVKPQSKQKMDIGDARRLMASTAQQRYGRPFIGGSLGPPPPATPGGQGQAPQPFQVEGNAQQSPTRGDATAAEMHGSVFDAYSLQMEQTNDLLANVLMRMTQSLVKLHDSLREIEDVLERSFGSCG